MPQPANRKNTRRPKAASPPSSPSSAEPETTQQHLCTVGFCPICLLVSATAPLKPDVAEHLLNAGREVLLAVKAVVDARADDVPGKDGGPQLERIDLA